MSDELQNMIAAAARHTDIFRRAEAAGRPITYDEMCDIARGQADRLAALEARVSILDGHPHIVQRGDPDSVGVVPGGQPARDARRAH